MVRRGILLPLLIGGATTSRIHTAVKIAPQYSEATVHVLDASRAVGVVQALLDPKEGEAYAAKMREEYARLKADHEAKRQDRKLLDFASARARRFAPDWKREPIERPAFLGRRVLADFPLRELVPFIDWSPFFHAWELKGVYPKILSDKRWGEKARELFEDAQKLLKEIVEKKLLRASAVYGFWPANSLGEEIGLPKPSPNCCTRKPARNGATAAGRSSPAKNFSRRSSGASGPRPVTPPARTTPKSGPSSRCSALRMQGSLSRKTTP